jgi:hypothetical protein
MDTINVVEINIKILNDKYEIFLDKIISNHAGTCTSYIGRNIITNEKIIIDIYSKNILFIARKIISEIIKINHQNIIKILDVIIEKNISYIIKPYYEKFIYYNLIKDTNLINIFLQIFEGINYLFINNIEIEQLTTDNIFIYNNDIIISPYFAHSDVTKTILYGSPLYYPINLSNKIKIENEKKIISNTSLLLINLFNNSNILNNDIFRFIINQKYTLFDIINFLISYNNNTKTNIIDKNNDDIFDIFQLEL